MNRIMLAGAGLWDIGKDVYSGRVFTMTQVFDYGVSTSLVLGRTIKVLCNL